MPLFKHKSLPPTSYGYVPPTEATAQGWKCTKLDCGFSDLQPVQRWPKQCPQCGSATDPIFDQPWEHDAYGVELQWLMRIHSERGGGLYEDQWQIWQIKDALLRGDRNRAAAARVAARERTTQRLTSESWWGPHRIFFEVVWYDLEAGDLDWAADDLIFWFSVSSTEDVENNNTNRTNSRSIIDMTTKFIAAAGMTHPRTPEIRAVCLKIAEDAYPILNRDQQETVTRIARN